MKMLRTASTGSNFTGSYKKEFISAIHKPFEYNIWWNCLKFSDKMDPPIRMRTFDNAKH